MGVSDDSTYVSIIKPSYIKTASGGLEFSLVEKRELAKNSIEDIEAGGVARPQRVVMLERYFSDYDVSSSDNEEIVVSEFNKETKSSRLWLVDGQSKSQVIQKMGYLSSPTFSPDNEYVVFSHRDFSGRNQYVYKTKKTGLSGLSRIVAGAPVVESASLSEDGKTLVYTQRETARSVSFIWTQDINGNYPTQLRSGVHPSWHGDLIYFQRKDEGNGFYSIWSVPFKGGQMQQVIAESNADVTDVSISPDGRYIAYVVSSKQRDNLGDIYIRKIDNPIPIQITSNASRDDLPKWSSDSEFVYFRSSRGGAWSIWRMNIEGLGL